MLATALLLLRTPDGDGDGAQAKGQASAPEMKLGACASPSPLRSCDAVLGRFSNSARTRASRSSCQF